MGLFDVSQKARDAASEVDTESLSAEEGSEEAINAISQHQKNIQDSNIEEKSTQNLWNHQMMIGKILTRKKSYICQPKDDEWEDWMTKRNTLPTKSS